MINGFRYSTSGQFKEIHGAGEVGLCPEPGEMMWLDFEAPTPEEGEILSSVFRFHPLAIEDCWHEPQQPKVDDYGDYVFLVVHGVRYDAERDEFLTHELNIFLGANFLVSFHSFHSRSVEATQTYVRRNPHVMARGMDFMLHHILDKVIDNYFPKLEIIEDKIDDLEASAFTNPTPELLNRLFDLRRTVAHIKRVATQEREVLVSMSRGEFPFVSKRARLYFKDIYDHLFRIVDVADNHRETMNTILQVYVSLISNQLNNTMRVLTLIATLMLPLTVITGIYGMNFDNMPELHWRYGYHAVLLVMVGLGAGMVIYFKKRKWL
jgi:magnesium transporter